MTPCLLVLLLGAAPLAAELPPPPPILEDPEADVPVPSRVLPTDDEPDDVETLVENRRAANEESARAVKHANEPVDLLAVSAAQVATGTLSAAAFSCGALSGIGGGALLSSGGAGCTSFACITGGVLLCAMPAAVAVVETTLGDVMTGSSKSLWLPLFAAYGALLLDSVILGATGFAAVVSFQLLGNWGPFLVGAIGISLALVLLGIAPAMAYAIAEEETADGVAGPLSPLFHFGRSHSDDDMFF